MKPITLVVLAITLTGLRCRDLGEESDIRVVRPLTLLEKQVAEASNGFGLHLLSTINAGEAGNNVFIAPLSVSMALGMTLNGARGSTAEALAATLGYAGMSTGEINRTYSSLISYLHDLDPTVSFAIANSIWHRQNLDVLPDFVAANQRYFGATVRGLDFSQPTAAHIINQWVDQSTRGRIPTIVEDPIPSDIVMYIINAIYFKGTWRYRFDADLTADAPFHLPDGTTQSARLMQVEATLRYARTASYQAVELPYGDAGFCMIVVLPAEGQTIESFVSALTVNAWNDIRQDLHDENGVVMLPKFSFDWHASLKPSLSAMGMGIAFGEGADFRGIRSAGDLKITDVVHSSFVRVDEEGTEAAAVTAVIIGVTSVPDPGFVMRVDRPFFFAIADRSSGALVFAGKIVHPEWPG